MSKHKLPASRVIGTLNGKPVTWRRDCESVSAFAPDDNDSPWELCIDGDYWGLNGEGWKVLRLVSREHLLAVHALAVKAKLPGFSKSAESSKALEPAAKAAMPGEVGNRLNAVECRLDDIVYDVDLARKAIKAIRAQLGEE